VQPKIQDQEADRVFRDRARAKGFDPDDRWMGGYVETVWARQRFLLTAYTPQIARSDVLEFGCNVGGTSIVLAHLGAKVTAIDINPDFVELARLNARRYGVTIDFRVVADTTALPFAAGSFGMICAGSVLEYVAPELLRPIEREFDRVLAQGGVVLVKGTSSRLHPREVHSGRWFVNYLPSWVDRALGRVRPWQRGIWPWQITGGFPGYCDLAYEDKGAAYFAAAKSDDVSPLKVAVLRGLASAARPLGWSVGLLTPSMYAALMKPGAPGVPVR
jgi:SAM-dependent methyltransferase